VIEKKSKMITIMDRIPKKFESSEDFEFHGSEPADDPILRNQRQQRETNSQENSWNSAGDSCWI